MAHKIKMNGEYVNVATSHETWLADGITFDQIPPKSVAALVAMGHFSKDDPAVQAKMVALTAEAKALADAFSEKDCSTCEAKRLAKAAAAKAEAEAKAALAKEPAPEAEPMPEPTPEPTAKKTTRKRTTKTTAKT